MNINFDKDIKFNILTDPFPYGTNKLTILIEKCIIMLDKQNIKFYTEEISVKRNIISEAFLLRVPII